MSAVLANQVEPAEGATVVITGSIRYLCVKDAQGRSV